MRIILTALAIALSCSVAVAQTNPVFKSDGRTDLKAHQENNQQQPQGPTGPLNTTTGGAPASSPQGQTPPGMQAAPEGSSKTIVDSPNK